MKKVCVRKDCDFKGVAQPVDNFTRQIQNVGGKSHTCKSCISKIRKRTKKDSWMAMIIGNH